jgi:hypothetical protein
MKMGYFSIDALVEDLQPVRRVKPRDNLLLVVGATLIASFIVAMTTGVRADVMAGNPHPIVIIRAGLLLLLGLATTLAVATAARPSVGKPHNGWMWALAAASLFPLAAFCQFVYDYFAGQPLSHFSEDFEFGMLCLTVSCLSALWVGGFLTLWLRRGAPIALNRAGWLVGIASGSFGTFCFNVHCNSVSIFYIGFWYSLAVALCAVAGRLIVPRLIRW